MYQHKLLLMCTGCSGSRSTMLMEERLYFVHNFIKSCWPFLKNDITNSVTFEWPKQQSAFPEVPFTRDLSLLITSSGLAGPARVRISMWLPLSLYLRDGIVHWFLSKRGSCWRCYKLFVMRRECWVRQVKDATVANMPPSHSNASPPLYSILPIFLQGDLCYLIVPPAVVENFNCSTYLPTPELSLCDVKCLPV